MQKDNHRHGPANRLGGQIQVEQRDRRRRATRRSASASSGGGGSWTAPSACAGEPRREHDADVTRARGGQMKSSGRGLSASARRSSGVISRLIGTPQIACACASSAARSASAAAAPFVQIGSCGGSGSFGAVHVERIAVGSAAAHLQRPEHVGRAAGERPAAAPVARRPGRPAAAAAARPPARPRPRLPIMHEEALEDAGRQERGEPVVGLIQAEAVQVARRRLEVVAGRAAARPCRTPSRAFRRRGRRSSRSAARGSARRRRRPVRLR